MAAKFYKILGESFLEKHLKNGKQLLPTSALFYSKLFTKKLNLKFVYFQLELTKKIYFLFLIILNK